MTADAGGYETVEHTADLSIRAWAPDLAGLIEQAARGMLALMLDSPLEASGYREVAGQGCNAEELLVDCLREVLALVNIERLVPVSVDVTSLSGDRALCRVGVVAAEDAHEALRQEIKAVTYHGLDIACVGDGLEVTVVFDV